MRIIPSLLATTLLASAAFTAACTDREVARVDPKQNKEQKKEIPVEINRNLDILFVIDNSNSMRDEQTSLAANFNNFINVLNNIEGGLPNVHIGVVTTDLGAGPYNITGCTGNGDNGLLQNAPVGGAGCSAPTDRYIIDLANEDGSRQKNYTGGLAESFSCIAQLGVNGCGFEQPLESMYRALNGTNAANEGFIREDAFLAVIIITDEDDCSVTDPSMFNSDSSLDNISSSLGFLSSFRCFEFGVTCDPDSPRSAGPRQDCVAQTSSPYMADISKYSEFLKTLKTDPAKIIVAGIRGPGNVVSVALKDGEPKLAPSCCRDANCNIDSENKADPAVRIDSFLESFPNRNTATTICNEDLSDALTVIAELLTEVLGNPCIDGDLKLTDGQPTCTVTDVSNKGKENESQVIVPLCNADNSNLPCYHFDIDTEECSNTPTQLALTIERSVDPENTVLEARCESN